MWQNLKQADIERAKQELQLRRQEILGRHAEELRGFDAERAEIESLAEMAEAFAKKFTMAAPSSIAAATPESKKPPSAT
jgi:hypothetical protein